MHAIHEHLKIHVKTEDAWQIIKTYLRGKLDGLHVLREHILRSEAGANQTLALALQMALAVRIRQNQQLEAILRIETYLVGVQVLEKRAIYAVRVLVHLDLSVNEKAML